MKNMKTVTLMTAACGLTLIVNAQTAEPLAQAARFWNDPSFVQSFMGSYGVEAEDEPTVTREEAQFLGRLVDQIKTDLPGAIRSLHSAIKSDSGAALDFTLANLRLQEGRLAQSTENRKASYDAAILHYEAAIKKFPGFLRAHKNLGLVYAEQQRFPEALASLSRALELGGEDGNAYGVMGYSYLKVSRHLSAKVAYSRALLFAPDNVNWKIGYAECLRRLEEHREAAGLFDALIQGAPDDASYWLYQADSFHLLGQDQRAALNYEIVRRMGKATPPVLNILGDIYSNLGLLELAFGAYTEAFDLEPTQDLNRPLRSVEILTGHGRHQDAETLLARIREKAGNSLNAAQQIESLRLTSRIQLATDRAAEAIKTLEQIVAREPMDGESLLLLGDGYARLRGDDAQQRRAHVAKAALCYERAGKLARHTHRALIQHAQLLVAEREYAKALPLLRRAQKIEPRDSVSRYLEQVEQIVKTL